LDLPARQGRRGVGNPLPDGEPSFRNRHFCGWRHDLRVARVALAILVDIGLLRPGRVAMTSLLFSVPQFLKKYEAHRNMREMNRRGFSGDWLRESSASLICPGIEIEVS
jgi:hypothetical protein